MFRLLLIDLFSFRCPSDFINFLLPIRFRNDRQIRPFFGVIETPGSGNVVRIVNTAPVEFPMFASVKPYHMEPIDAWSSDGIQIDKDW